MAILSLIDDAGDLLVDDAGLILIDTSGLDLALLAHYKLDETSGTTLVDSGPLGNDATLSGDTADNMTTAGVIGRALQFSGAESGVGSFGGGLEYPFSMAGWAWKPTGGGSVFAAAFHDIGNAVVYWGLQVGSGGAIYVVRRNTTAISNSTGVILPLDEWVYVAVECVSPTHAKLWINGTLVWEDDALTSVLSSTGTDGMLLGDFRTTDVGSQWDGLLDDWRFYARGLSDQDVADQIQFSYNPSKYHGRIRPTVRPVVQPTLRMVQ